jgi:hypothetical protein
MACEIIPAHDVPLAEQARIFSQAFAGYVGGSFEMDAAALGALEYPDLPWPVSRHAIAKIASGRAFRAGNALIVTGDPKVTPARLHALSCPSSEIIDWAALRSALTAFFTTPF